MTLSRMSITLPTELLDAVIERANHDNVTRSALTIKALTAYLEGSDSTQDNTEIIRIRTQLEGKDELIKSKNETIGALRLALDIRNITNDSRDIEGNKQNSNIEKRSLQFLEANNHADYSIAKKKRPSRDLNPSRSLDRAP
jgi:hypothetical protein